MLAVKKRSALIVARAATRYSLLTELLQEFDFPVVLSALSTRNALERMQLIAFDIIFVEIEGIGDSAFEFVRQVRFGAKEIQRTPIVVVSGDSTQPFVVKARDYGASGLLTKPFSRASLAQQIGRALDDQREFVSSPSFSGPDRRRSADPVYRGPERRMSAHLIE